VSELVLTITRYQLSEGKADTFSVEADNAELRHSLARLARKSRCFSHRPYALECALRLFSFAYNSRQRYKQRYQNYPAHVMDFVSPPTSPLPEIPQRGIHIEGITVVPVGFRCMVDNRLYKFL
jgi:hypothetical protein